jgi:nicotinate-nucleotide adenylyltransferase
VVSPQNPLKEKGTLLNENHRKHLVDLALEKDIRLKSSGIEFKLPRPSYTIDTLVHLKEKFPQHNFTVIIGSDSFRNFDKWKNGDVLLKNYNLLIYTRPGFPIKKEGLSENIMVVENAPLLHISSSYIRNLIKDRKSIRYLVPEVIREEILNQQFYF